MSPLRSARARRTALTQCGFSLIELIAVLAVTSILAAVAVPALSNIGSARPKLAARQLARDLGFARERALTTGITTWASVNLAAATFSLLVENPSAPGRAGAVALTDPACGKAFIQRFGVGDFTGVSIIAVAIGGGTHNEVGFDWLGRPLDQTQTLLSTTGTISLTGGNSISIEPMTGSVRTLP